MFVVPSLAETIDELVRDFQNRFPGATVAKKTENWIRLATVGVATTMLHRHIQQVDKDLWPDTATGEPLDRHAEVRGLQRREATISQKASALRVTGAAGTSYAIGDELTNPAGLRFQVNENLTLGVSETADLDIASIDTGSATRLKAGEILTFSSAPAGSDPKAELVLDIDEGGADREDDGQLQTRILDRIAQPGMGGNSNDYRQWAKEVAGIFEAYVWPGRGGLGSVHLAATHNGTGEQRLLSAGEISDLQDYLDTKRPVSVADFLVLTIVAATYDLDIELEADTDPAFQWDWDDSLGWTVAAWNAGTRTMQLSANRPADMQVGDRIVYARTTGTLNSGKPYTIESFGASADEIILAGDQELTDLPPVVGNPVYGSGPLDAPVRANVQAYLDQLGPQRYDTFDGSSDYSAGGTYWDGVLRATRIQAAAQEVDGVVDSTVAGANQVPENVAPATTVEMAVVRQMLIRRM
jgi:uncharacterized phage protein gp47/JayE